ncbi:MAG: nickel-dependent lactate racemase [Verrucomicrobia bacterium]|nr:nickel-dependent lactate racemase [Verrucomicrobiota bacterium]
MRVELAYGRGHLAVEMPDGRTTVIAPAPVPGLADEEAAVRQALEHPIGSDPLRQRLPRDGRVCVLFTDATRATPNERLIPWLLEHLEGVPTDNLVLLNETGTHRPAPREELERLLTPAVAARYRVVNNEPDNPAAFVPLGMLRDGTPALINRHVVDADLRIVTGFIEPHFFAGFSGGVKGIIPGAAALSTVTSNHGPRNLSDPNATFGVTEGNPLWEELREVALRAGPSFLVNVTLNEARQITGVFAGDMIEAHRAGGEFVRRSAMQAVEAPFDIVVTTNSGYPLDLNLYQGVKGISAAARIVKPGGTILLASECREGVPSGSPMDRLLRSAAGPEALLAQLNQPGFSHPEQWQAQILAQIQCRAEVRVFSSLPPEVLRAIHLEPCADLETDVRQLLAGLPASARVAVLPQGPLTIPYLASS